MIICNVFQPESDLGIHCLPLARVNTNLDKRWYQVNVSFSPRKHMLWVVLLMSTHNICFCGEIRNVSTLFG